MHDLIIKNGTIVDGTGAERFEADVAVDGALITGVGRDLGRARREIDASGLIVTPGFVDAHTHYDAQVTWDGEVSPSSWHGVTTVVMGNCGVGFAPAAPDRHDWLISLMEGVEDIPGAAMHEGIRWSWESFPEYLSALAPIEAAVDFATQVPHGPLRAYVMRDRSYDAATREDLSRMAALTEEAIRAGALGFSTSRTLLHKGSDGVHVPGTFAPAEELLEIARGMSRAQRRAVFQMTSNHVDMPKELPWMTQIAREFRLPVSFNLLQTDPAPELYRDLLGELDRLVAEGLPIRAQVAGRPAGVLMSWEGTVNPFLSSPHYLELMHLPVNERIAQLRRPEVRRAIVGDTPFSLGEFEDYILASFHKMFQLGATPDYEPEQNQSAAAMAQALGCTAREVVYDWLMEHDGRGVVYFPIFGYSGFDHEALRQMLVHPGTVLGLADGGAHCGAICDVSMPTFMLTHWARDRHRGPRIPLEQVVKGQTLDSAELYGLRDRGIIKRGYRADLNVIDWDALTLEAPRIAYDLPAGGRRFVQGARGYRATLVSGTFVSEQDERTGARPGRLLRGVQEGPHGGRSR